mmetsp:Transcript_6796/g.11091  ORF Transcript_6796/g.11091 Transcript_6796/m.11091 type:complete len:200 (+) Transcript_6796:15-614(+)
MVCLYLYLYQLLHYQPSDINILCIVGIYIYTASNYKTTQTEKDFYYLYSGARQGWLGMQAAMRFFFNFSSSATISIIASTFSLDTPIISAMQKIASFSFSSRPSFDAALIDSKTMAPAAKRRVPMDNAFLASAAISSIVLLSAASAKPSIWAIASGVYPFTEAMPKMWSRSTLDAVPSPPAALQRAVRKPVSSSIRPAL